MNLFNDPLLTYLIVAGIILIILRIALKVAKTLISVGIAIIAIVILFLIVSNFLAPAL